MSLENIDNFHSFDQTNNDFEYSVVAETVEMLHHNHAVTDFVDWVLINSDVRVNDYESKLASSSRPYSGFDSKLIDPKPSESLLSLIIRQAHSFDMTPKQYLSYEINYWKTTNNLELFDATLERRNWRWLNKIDVLPLNEDLIESMFMRGLSRNLKTMQIKFFTGYNKFIWKQCKTNVFYYYRLDLTYCPVCWLTPSNRYFKTEWRLPFVFVCFDHGAELQSRCTACNELLFNQTSVKSKVNDFSKDWFTNCKSCHHPLLFTDGGENKERALKLANKQKKVYNNLLSNKAWGTVEGYRCFIRSFISLKKSHVVNNGLEDQIDLMEKILSHQVVTSKIYNNYLCHVCGDLFNRSKLHNHIWRFHQTNSCRSCDKEISNPTSYSEHIWGCGKTIICPNCPKEFKNTTANVFRDHVWNCNRDRFCGVCGKNYRSKTRKSYNDHVWGCNQDRICPDCGKNYKNMARRSYRFHIWGCNKDGFCSGCGKNFKDKTKNQYDKHVKKCVF